MKTNINAILMCAGAALFLIAGSTQTAQAQISNNFYGNIDWQLNVPLGKTFAKKTSGWGMNFEGGYNINDKFSVGLFIAYSTNFEHIDRRTIELSPTSTINTDQEHSLFQMPFGVSGRYNFLSGSIFNPYVGVKIGPEFARLNSYYYVVRQYENTWGFYASPEIGVNIYPGPAWPCGFHVAAYYSYATNKGNILNYSLDDINNFGVRVGIVF